MSTTNTLKIGLFGFGCVGQGLYEVLQNTKGLQAEIVKICIKNPDKPRSLPQHYFTTNANDLLYDININVIVELIDTADEAYSIVSTALKNGKHVVSANKKMLAEHLQELYELQQSTQKALLYEASSCASIPIIRNLEEYYDNDLLDKVQGIFNGSTNYILTKVIHENLSYETALKTAQELGFAESNPALDVEGYDAKYKLCIVLQHAFGVFTNPNEVFNYGITAISQHEVNTAKQRNKHIKLLAHCSKTPNGIAAYVLPTLVPAEHNLANVINEYNAVELNTAFTESQFQIGKGAGSTPTGSAVLSDIAALRYQYKYEYKKLLQNGNQQLTNNFELTIYLRHPANFNASNLFNTVTERYESQAFCYTIGTTTLQQIKAADFLNNKDFSLLNILTD